jgi:hypothetical protein
MRFATLFLIPLLVWNASVGAVRPRNRTARQLQPQASLDSVLDKRISDYRTSGRTLIATLVDLAYEYKLPMGIEYVDREAAARPIDLEFHDDFLRNILEDVVAQLPEYRVSFLGEVVEVYSPRAREDSSDLLNKPIGNYSVDAVDTRDADLELACALSRELEPASLCGGSITNGQWGPLKITLRLRNARVYEILDAILGQNGRAIWTVTAVPEKLSNIQVGGLWHIYPLEDSFKATVVDRLSNMFAGRSSTNGPEGSAQVAVRLILSAGAEPRSSALLAEGSAVAPTSKEAKDLLATLDVPRNESR